MHPIMSDIDLSVRQFEQSMERTAREHRLLVASVARQREVPGVGTRLVHAVWQFIDPRGFALAQYRRNQLQQTPVETSSAPRPAATPALMHAFPIAEISDAPDWRQAA